MSDYYYGLLITPGVDVARIPKGPLACGSFAHRLKPRTAAAVCQSFILDSPLSLTASLFIEQV